MEPVVRRHFWRLHKRLKYYSNSNDKSGKSNKILISYDLKSKDRWEVVIVMVRVVNLNKILISYDLKIKDKWKVQTENHVDKLDFIH